MTFTAEITETESVGDTLRLTCSHVQRHKAPQWHGYCPEVKLDVPLSQAKNFLVGRKVTIELQLERGR
jgi:hypothetical protein